MGATETKEIILRVAGKLFAEKGFNGVSVREISKAAEVNLSSVNYHFTTKAKLYEEVFIFNYKWLSDSINAIGDEKDIDTKKLAWRTYQFFTDNSEAFLNTYKIFISNEIDIFEEESCLMEAESFGPPGQEAFLKKISEDIGQDATFDGCHWAMRMIFSDIVHFAIHTNCPAQKHKAKTAKYFEPEEKKKSIFCLVEAILEYLERNPKLF